MQYTEILQVVKIENFQWKFSDIFLIVAQNKDCGYTLEPPPLAEAVLTSTHNLCFGAKIRKIGKPLHTPVLLYKIGVQHGHVFRMNALKRIGKEMELDYKAGENDTRRNGN